MRAGIVMLGTVATLGLAAPTAAQFGPDGPSVLSLLPAQGSVQSGSEQAGRLVETDYVASGRRVQAWSLEGTSGEPVTVDVISDDFDAYAYLLGPDGSTLESDDDSGGACHARISMFLPEDGTYLIVAASLSGDTGAYTLRVSEREQAPASGACGGGFTDTQLLDLLGAIEPLGTVTLGDSIEGTLEIGDHEIDSGDPDMGPEIRLVEAYELVGDPGTTVVVDLASRDFDTVLFVLEPGGEDFVTDDDSGGACNSRVEITLGMQPHTLIVSPFSEDGTGAFTIRVGDEWGPRATGECPLEMDLDAR